MTEDQLARDTRSFRLETGNPYHDSEPVDHK